nr:hypothetical protein [uncultured organism]
MFLTHQRRAGSLALPLASIVRATSTDGGWRVTDVQGETHLVDSTSWDIALQLTPISSVPAQPGTYLLSRIDEEDGSTTIERVSVLGWMVCADLVTRPISLDTEALIGEWFVEMPDGHVEGSVGGAKWPTVEAWQNDKR